MNQYTEELQRIWHSTVHRWNEKRSRRRPRRPFWDVLILTAANAQQARGYELEIARRSEIGMIDPETRVLVVPDRAGKRIGSGGATLWALREYARTAKRTDNLFQGKRILMMHCGGEGRRVPSNAGTGKLFAPLPFEVVPGRAASPFDAMFVFLCACGEQMTDGMVLVAGDVLAVFDPTLLHWHRNGVSGIGIPAPLDLAAQHGVYVPDETGRRVARYPQKVSQKDMLAQGIALDGQRALVDGAGILRFSPEVCARLAALAGVSPENNNPASGIVEDPRRRGESIDLYTDIAWAFVPATQKTDYLESVSEGKRFVRETLWKALRGKTFWLDVLEESVFVHLGNLWQILDSFAPAEVARKSDPASAASIFGGRDTIASFVSPSIRLHRRAHVQNSCINGPTGIVGADSLVAECHLRGCVQIGAHCLVRGIDTDRDLTVRDNIALFAVALDRRETAFCIHGVEDNPKCTLDDARFLGMTLTEWLKMRGIAHTEVWDDATPPAERTLWNARLHPTGEADALSACLWMQDAQPAPETASLWRQNRRVSFETVFARVDYAAGFRRRENLVRENLLANVERELTHRRDPRPFLGALGTIGEFEELRNRLHTWIERTPHPLIAARMLSFEAELLKSRPLEDALRRTEKKSDRQPPAIPISQADRNRESTQAQNAALRKVAQAVASGVTRTDALDLSRVVTDKVRIESPARIDFGGGWTDTPPQCLETGGVILSAAVRLNGVCPIAALAEKIDERAIILETSHGRGTAILKNDEDLPLYQSLDDPFALLKAGLAAVGFRDPNSPNLQQRLEQWGHGIRIVTHSAVPKGSGLGTSSILGATLIACLRRLFGADLDREAIFRQVLYLEQLLTSGGGWQDQIGALVPGIKLATVPADTTFLLRPEVHPLKLSSEVLAELNRRLVLFYVGKRRIAFNMLRQIVVGYLSGQTDVTHALRAIHDLAFEQREALESGDLERFGAQMTRVRMLYRLICPATTSDLIEDIFAAAAPYASGGKCVGAGGGGFIMVMARDAKNAERTRERLKEFSWRGLGEFYDFAIDTEGLRACAV